MEHVKDKLVQYIRIIYALQGTCNSILLRSFHIDSKLEYGLSAWEIYMHIKSLKCFTLEVVQIIIKIYPYEKPLYVIRQT